MPPPRLRPLLAYSSVAALGLALGPTLRGWLGGALPEEVARDAWWATVLGAWALCALVDLALRLPRRALWLPLAALAWWLGMETFAAPHLVAPLRLKQLVLIRDVDHRPVPFTKGTNVDGLRATPPPEAFAEPGFNLLVLGDSFTWGYRVEAEEAFPAVTGELLRERLPELPLRVANFGWTSSSPLLSWRRLVDQGERYRPHLVVLAVDMTDFSDDLRWERMLARRGLYRLYDRLPIALRLFEAAAGGLYRRMVVASAGGGPVERYFACERPLEQSRPWMAPLRRNVDRIAAWCRERGADFVVVVLPRPHQYDERESPHNWEADRYTTLGPYSLEPFRFFEELAAEVDYGVVSLLDDFRARSAFPTCFESDPHWNPTGHRVAALGLARELEPRIAARLERSPEAFGEPDPAPR